MAGFWRRVFGKGGSAAEDAVDLGGPARAQSAPAAPPGPSTRPTAPAPPAKKVTPLQLARSLQAEFPNGVPTDALFDQCEAIGLDVQAVDRHLDVLAEEGSRTMAPILDGMAGDAYRVSGECPSRSSTRMWVHVPRADELRKYARTL